MEHKQIYLEWYYNPNIELRNFIHWEIFKDSGAKRHSLDFILAGKNVGSLPCRFYKCGNFHFFIGQIKERFINCELEPSWHFFRSVGYLRFTSNGEPTNLKTDFNEQMYGFDIIFDMDNKPFKKWWLKEGELNSPKILPKINEHLLDLRYEVNLIKEVLDKYKCPYILNFSGTGFRIAIDWNDIKECFSVNDFGVLDREFVNWVLKQVKCKKCDTYNKTIHTMDESTFELCLECGKQKGKGNHQFQYFGELGSGYCLTRVLYSLHPISKLAVFPLSDEEFKNFNLDMVNPEHILKTIKIIKSTEPLNKKRKGNFKEIFEAFKSDLPKDYKQPEQTKSIKNSRIEEIKSMISKLSEQEKKELLKEVK